MQLVNFNIFDFTNQIKLIMKNFVLSLITICFIFSCSNTTSCGPSAADVANFNKHVDSWKEAISGFSSEEPEKVMSIFADSLKWNNPEALMNVNKSKEDLTAAVNFYISTFDNIKFTEDVYYGGSLYSSEEASSSPDGLRIYGNWVFNDPETGVEVSYKWMGVAQFNEDGKVHNFADWFDVSSIPSQIAGTYQR